MDLQILGAAPDSSAAQGLNMSRMNKLHEEWEEREATALRRTKML